MFCHSKGDWSTCYPTLLSETGVKVRGETAGELHSICDMRQSNREHCHPGRLQMSRWALQPSRRLTAPTDPSPRHSISTRSFVAAAATDLRNRRTAEAERDEVIDLKIRMLSFGSHIEEGLHPDDRRSLDRVLIGRMLAHGCGIYPHRTFGCNPDRDEYRKPSPAPRRQWKSERTRIA